MLSYEEARALILSHVAPLGGERVGILDALGRVACADLTAPWDMPAWDNSAMDGYAVRAHDCSQPVSLTVTGYLAAGGTSTSRVTPGTACTIMTGAPLPPGADAVVPVEETDGGRDAVRILTTVEAGQHVRRQGEDIIAGDIFLALGAIIRPPNISMLASFNKALVPVYCRPRVAILSTGDELVELGEPLQPGRIINSNSLALAAAVQETGAKPVMIGIARDNPADHREKITAGLQADVLITSAGVSAGQHDLVRDILREAGVEQLFWRVAIKPGGPTAFGMYETTPVFSLPGNPVSSLIAFAEFVRPALLKMMGHSKVVKPFIKVTLLEELRKKPGKVHLVRLIVESNREGYVARSAGNQQTGILKTMATANALAILPTDRTEFNAGEEVNVHLLDEMALMVEG